ncbi:MAG: hypothetical protein ACRC6E_08275 [Fusobacteriaceae bacterium]
MARKLNIKDDVFAYIQSNNNIMQTMGMSTYSDFDYWFNALNSLERIDVVIAMINSLESLDPMISSVSYTTKSAQAVEEYLVAKFKAGNWDTMGKSYKPTLQNLNIPYDDYDCSISISEKLLMRDEYGVVGRVIEAVVPAYKKLLRGLALEAMMVLPEDQSKYAPCFWRNTSTFSNPSDVLVPHPNGFAKFTSAESHYIGATAYAKGMLRELEKKVKSKGYGSTLVVVASETTWNNYRNEYTIDDLEKIEFIGMSEEFAPVASKPNYVSLPDTEFPEGYFFAYDPTIQFVAHKVCDIAGKEGLVRMFNTFDEVRTNHRAEFKVLETGYGVVQKGAGAVLSIGSANYVNPDFSSILG